MNESKQLTFSDFDTCGYGSSISAQAVVLLPPEPQVSQPEIVFNDTSLTYEQNIARLEWRILIQVIALQINEMHTEPNPEVEQWRERIKRTLERVNEKGNKFRPSRVPSDIHPPTAVCLAQNASGANWCEELMKELAQLFGNVPTAGTLKIELFPLDAVPAERKVGTASSYNSPAVLATGDISIPQEQTSDFVGLTL